MGLRVGVAEGRTAVGEAGIAVGVEGRAVAVGVDGSGVVSTWNEKVHPSSISALKIETMTSDKNPVRFMLSLTPTDPLVTLNFKAGMIIRPLPIQARLNSLPRISRIRTDFSE